MGTGTAVALAASIGALGPWGPGFRNGCSAPARDGWNADVLGK